MSHVRGPAILLFLALAGGCASHRPAGLPRLLVSHPTAADLGYRIAWPADLGLHGDNRVLFAQLLGDKFVTFESGNLVSVLEASTGRMLWRTTVGSPLERFGAPQREGDRLILCSETRCHLYDIQIGGLIKVINLSHVSNTNPLILGGLMIHGSPKGLAYGQSIDSGLLVWSFNIGGGAAADPVKSGPYVILTSDPGWVYAFNPSTGVPAWRDHTWGRISAPTAATDTQIYVACEDRSLYAFAREPGRPKSEGKLDWRYYTDQRLKTRPYIFGDNLYQFVPHKGLVALDAATGKEKWTLKWGDARPFMLKAGRLYVLRRGQIAVVTPDDGLVLQQIPTPNVQDVVPQTPTGGDLYLIHSTGRLLKLVPQ